MDNNKILKCPHCCKMTMKWDEQQDDWCCQSCGYIGFLEENLMDYILPLSITASMEKSPISSVDRKTFIQVLKYIDDFVHHLPGGTSYWIDPRGFEHHTDVGYGIDFWEQVKEYLENN